MSTSSQSYLGASQNLVSSCSGAVQPLLSSQVSLPATTTSYYAIQSGQIISVGALNAPCTITLPPVATSAGHMFTVVVTANLTQTLTIAAQTLCMRGFGLQPAAVGTAAQAVSSLAQGVAAGTAANGLVISAANSRPGDRVELKCDGFQWFVQAWAGNAIGSPVFSFN